MKSIIQTLQKHSALNGKAVSQKRGNPRVTHMLPDVLRVVCTDCYFECDKMSMFINYYGRFSG